MTALVDVGFPLAVLAVVASEETITLKREQGKLLPRMKSTAFLAL